MLTYPQQLAADVLADGAALDARLCRALNARDVEGVVSCFASAPVLVVLPGGAVVRCRETLRGALGSWFGAHPELSVRIEECTRHAAGEVTLAVGTARCALRGGDGSARQLLVRWTDVRRRQHGEWTYLLVHVSAASGWRSIHGSGHDAPEEGEES